MYSLNCYRPLWLICTELISYSLKETEQTFRTWVSEQERNILALFIPQGHILRRYEEKIEYQKIKKILEQAYSGNPGGILPIETLKLFKLYLVSYIYPVVSERELVRRASADMAIRRFCGFGLFEKIPNPSTLSKFRYRMGEERFESCFEEVLRQCASKKLLDGNTFIHDASKMDACATKINAFEQAKRLIHAFLKQIFGSSNFASQGHEDQKTLEEVCRQAARLVGYPIREMGSFLKALNHHGFSEGGVFLGLISLEKLKGIKVRDKMIQILSQMPHAVGDKDARMGRTSVEKKFLGYLFSFSIDALRQVITSVITTAGHTHCSAHLKEAYQKHKDIMKKLGMRQCPKRASLDAGYDNVKARKMFEEDRVQAYIRPSEKENKHGVFSTGRFFLTPEGQMICPAGAPMRSGAKRSRKGGTLIYRGAGCESCNLHGQCTKVKIRTVEVNLEDHRLRQEALKLKGTHEFTQAMNERLIIEAVFGHGKSYHLLGKARYRNRAMVMVQCLMSAMTMNMEKIIRAA